MFTVVCYFDISKCFDCINHEILLFKLQKYGIRQKELEWFTSYISGRLQATFAHNTLSSFFSVTTGIPQGSILGPLLFLLYLNDLPKFIYNCSLYADDTMIQRSGTNIDSICNDIQNDVNKISQWFEFNKLTLNVEKSCIMLVGSKPNIANISTNDIKIYLNGALLNVLDKHTYLGLTIDSSLTWDDYINNLCRRLSSRVGLLQRLSNVLPIHYMNQLYTSFVQSLIDYCLTVYGQTSTTNLNKIQRFQNRAARICTANFDFTIPSSDIIKQLGWQCISQRIEYLTAILMYKCIHGDAPVYMSNYITYVNEVHHIRTRQSCSNYLHVPSVRTRSMQKSFQYYGPSLWNSLPNSVRNAPSLAKFKLLMKTYLRPNT